MSWSTTSLVNGLSTVCQRSVITRNAARTVSGAHSGRFCVVVFPSRSKVQRRLGQACRVKFGGPLFFDLKGGVIVDVLVIGLARFLTVLRLAC
jgi:hypothetical protein